MKEKLMILKNLNDKRVTVMDNSLEIYGDYQYKANFHKFFLSTDDTVFNMWRG